MMSALDPHELEPLLQELVNEFDDEAVRGVFLTGSYARRAADAWSDIDLVFVTHERTPQREGLIYRSGHLVSVSYIPLSHRFSVLADPDSALHAVRPFRATRPLLEKDSAVHDLRKRAQALEVSGAGFREEAGRRAAGFVCHQVEVVHKMMGALAAQDDLRVLTYTLELVQEMTRAATLLYT